MRKVLQIILLSIFPTALFASGENTGTGARAAAMGNSSVTLSDPWSAVNNQAGLVGVKAVSAGVFYENRFLINELGIKGGVLAIPTKTGVFGVSASSFGYKQFSENKFGLAFGKSLGENVSAGIQINYLNVQMGDIYGSKGIVMVEAGIITRISKNMLMGAHIYNPTRSKIAGYNDERIPAILRVGLNYRVSNKVQVCGEGEKDIDHKPVFKAGIEYLPVSMLFLRAGFSSNPSTSTFGFGINSKRLKIDVATGFHPVLGFSPQVSISYSLNSHVTQ